MFPFLIQGVLCNTLALNSFSSEYTGPSPLLLNGKSKQYLKKNSDFRCDSIQDCYSTLLAQKFKVRWEARVACTVTLSWRIKGHMPFRKVFHFQGCQLRSNVASLSAHHSQGSWMPCLKSSLTQNMLSIYFSLLSKKSVMNPPQRIIKIINSTSDCMI